MAQLQKNINIQRSDSNTFHESAHSAEINEEEQSEGRQVNNTASSSPLSLSSHQHQLHTFPNDISDSEQNNNTMPDQTRMGRRTTSTYYCFFILALLILIPTAIFTITFFASSQREETLEAEASNLNSSHEDNGSDVFGGEGENESVTMQTWPLQPMSSGEKEGCPANTKLFSVQHDRQERDGQSTTPGNLFALDNEEDDHGVGNGDDSDGYTWTLIDTCTNEVILECKPCSSSVGSRPPLLEKVRQYQLLQDEGEEEDGIINSIINSNLFQSFGREKKDEDGGIEERGEAQAEHSGGSIIIGGCIPSGDEYILQIRRIESSASSSTSCCGLSNPTNASFLATYDSTVVLAIEENGGDEVTNLSDTPLMQQEGMMAHEEEWEVRFGAQTEPCADREVDNADGPAVGTSAVVSAPPSSHSQAPSKNPGSLKEPTASPSPGQSEQPLTNSQTWKPFTNTPTMSSTAKPTTGSPSNHPIANPVTGSPSNHPTANTVTDTPTKAPISNPGTDSPSNHPTVNPVTDTPTKATSKPTTYAPTETPTPEPGIKCPPIGTNITLDNSNAAQQTLISVATSSPETYCGIFIKKEVDGYGSLIPYARSYNGNEWEASPGRYAIRSEGIRCKYNAAAALTLSSSSVCTIQLYALEDGSNDRYIILTKDGAMEEQKQIARFLEMTTFGPKRDEIDNLLNGGDWGPESRARYVRKQMDTDATSHREYYRRRANAKWTTSTHAARSDHPCSPNSLWRKYTFLEQDAIDMRSDESVVTTFETVAEEKNLVTRLYEADSYDDVSACGRCIFSDFTTSLASSIGYSGIGYYNFAANNDFIEWTFNVKEDGKYPISFRFTNGKWGLNGNRPLALYVNDSLFESTHDFSYTGGWSKWVYSDLVYVPLNSGSNKIKLVLEDWGGGPDIDHMRVGKPPAVIIRSNGWVRTVAKDGVGLKNSWGLKFTDRTAVTFPELPQPPNGQVRIRAGSTFVKMTNENKNGILDIGNPPVFFTGYEQYLPEHYITFKDDEFANAASQLYSIPIQEGQELLLTNGLTDPVCDRLPLFADEAQHAPVFGVLPDGEWVQWTPTIILEDNGPTINSSPEVMAKHTLPEGGGAVKVQSKGIVGCSNVPRSFINENTCLLSQDESACMVVEKKVRIGMTANNIIAMNNIDESYLYAIRGLGMEDLEQHPCLAETSRWSVKANSTCPEPTPGLGPNTQSALENAIKDGAVGDKNNVIKDINVLPGVCDVKDITTSNLHMQIRLNDGNCYIHVHKDHLNVYDFEGWVIKHPGGRWHIEKWATTWQGHEGWYLQFPYSGDAEKNIPQHLPQMWDNHVDTRDIQYVARLGDSFSYTQLPSKIQTDAMKTFFNSLTKHAVTSQEGGTVVCGSIGEVSNDPTMNEVFDFVSDRMGTTPIGVLNNHKQVTWTEVNLFAKDQLRQRMAWALAQIITVVPDDISTPYTSEKFVNFYDILVRNSFGSYLDILLEISYSPLMAEQLSYLKSQSQAYVYSNQNKSLALADENYAREIMQLFSIGLIKLHDNGTPEFDPDTDSPLETYTNEDIESLARAWTGFDKSPSRGNIEDFDKKQSDLDPMQINPDWRDPFPKSNLNGGFIGDKYIPCQDLPAQSFLKKGAMYKLLGGNPSPDLIRDSNAFANDATNSVLRAELDPSSQLYQRLHHGGEHDLAVELESDFNCVGIECKVDTLRVVKVGLIYYEYVERPCIQMAFYKNGKQIQLRGSSREQGRMCASPLLPVAREACCRKYRSNEVQTAKMETGVTYLYDGERMTWATARDRCAAYGTDLCSSFRSVSVSPSNDSWRTGYHWTNQVQDCAIAVKVNSDGRVAIVHDVDPTNINTIPYHVEREHTLNWFRVSWDGNGNYPGSNEANTCAANHCEQTGDGSCLCRPQIHENVVFDSIESIPSKADIMSKLFVGALGPPGGSTAIDLGNGVTVHMTGGNVDVNTVFQADDKGRTFYLKNTRSTVSLGNDWGGSSGTYSPYIEHMKLESEARSAFMPVPSFRNPPHFMSLIADITSPGVGEQNLRDAQYETIAVVEHYLYHQNMAPFLCTRIIQRFGISNPSPRYVLGCVNAFRSGFYSSGNEQFGSGRYGCLEAMTAAIILDKEATDPSLTVDPAHGSIREPIMKVMSLVRSMEYKNDVPNTPNGPHVPKDFQVRLWEIDKKIGQSPFEFPSIFSFMLPEYVPAGLPTLTAGLVSPEAMLLNMPNTLRLISGMWSLIRYGLSDCDGGFSSKIGFSSCKDDGQYTRSYGKLFYQPHGPSAIDQATDLSLLLTAGRLSGNKLATIAGACASRPNKANRTRCMQEIIVTTPEFHTTNTAIQSYPDNARIAETVVEASPEPYKAIVYFYLSGGCDSFNLLAPHTCTPIDVYDRYRKIREGVGLPLKRLLEIPANNPNQPCSSFGIHENLPVLKQLYDQRKLIFVANAGLLAKPVDTSNYRGETPVQLFAHNILTLETSKNDIANKYTGTGVGGRMADVLTKAGIPTNLFSLKGLQILLSGKPGGGGPSAYTLGSKGLSPFNVNPAIQNMTGLIKAMNAASTSDSGIFSGIYSSELLDAISKQQSLKAELDKATITSDFPDSDIANQLKFVTQIMSTAQARGAKRDIFYVSHRGYDTHSSVDEKLNAKFSIINSALEAFVEKLMVLNLWESTTVLQFSEFGRSLAPNTRGGTDHAWGGHHFMLGGSVKGGKVLGQYPHDFKQSSANKIALRRGRIIPTYPWDAMWKGAAEWFGVTSSDMEQVLPNFRNFPPELLYKEDELFESSQSLQ